jgi:Icc-related predicted phosphoesterase
MKICFMSDTHGWHNDVELPEANVLCHTGDFVRFGGMDEVNDFLQWFSSVGSFKHRIFIAGNHERVLEKLSNVGGLKHAENLHYLLDSSVVIDGVKFYGTPYQPKFCNWAFNLPEHELVKKWAMIPEDTDVLLTHCPPYGILDRCMDGYQAGSRSLLEEILKRNIKTHAFGHIHESYGYANLYNGIKFINSSAVNLGYVLTNDPIIVEINNETTNKH